MNELIEKVEQWSKDKGLDKAEPSKQFRFIEGFPNHVITTDGKVVVLGYIDFRGYKRKPKMIETFVTTDGYEGVKLTHLGTKKTTRVHRLVAEAFIENPELKETVNHIDGNKLNNHVSNLEWADRSEQLYHAYEHGLRVSTPVARLSAKVANGKPVKCLEKETGITKYFIAARDCSAHYGYSPRWCDKMISELGGDTRKFKFEYTTLDEVKANTEGVSLSTLVNLVELWSIDKNLNKAEPSKQFLKLVEELGECASALARGNHEALEDGIGDVVVTLIILAQQNGMTLEQCLNTAYSEIAERTGKMVDGVFVKSEDL